jgi:hypothetical protein
MKFTWRTIAIIATVLFLFGYPIYIYTDSLITGGITHRGDLLVVDLKALSSFEMDQDTGTTDDIPKRYRDLNNKRVLLTGQMWAPYAAADEKIRAFTLVYSISNCCFNGPPKVQHFIQATVPVGQSIDYSNDFVDVIGTLHVGVEQGEGHVQSVYRIDVEKVAKD